MQNNLILNTRKAPDIIQMIVLGIAFTTQSMSPQTLYGDPIHEKYADFPGVGDHFPCA